LLAAISSIMYCSIGSLGCGLLVTNIQTASNRIATPTLHTHNGTLRTLEPVALFITFVMLFQPELPGSSPVLFSNDDFFVITSFPSIFTFLLPDEVSLDIAVFGYGIGTGPLGDCGVSHTSGIDFIVLFSDAFPAISFMFASTSSSSGITINHTNTTMM